MSPKSNSLSDTDIKKIINAQGVKLNGIYMRDEFNKQKLKAGFYVVNMQSLEWYALGMFILHT